MLKLQKWYDRILERETTEKIRALTLVFKSIHVTKKEYIELLLYLYQPPQMTQVKMEWRVYLINLLPQKA